MIGKVISAQLEWPGSLSRVQQQAPDLWRLLVSNVRQTVQTMPLWKLQTVGSEQMDFLYDNVGSGQSIALKPGVAFCFRAFYGLLRDLIQGAWVRFVQKVNGKKFGSLTDLGTFLFGRERSALDAYRPILRDVQGAKCFYCDGDLRSGADVDHFVPWSRYPTDLGHNFVLAHRGCNTSKSDYLAAEQHLARWVERNSMYVDELDDRLTDAELPHDRAASSRVAEWAYEQTERAHGQVWVEKDAFQHLGPDWRRLLVA